PRTAWTGLPVPVSTTGRELVPRALSGAGGPRAQRGVPRRRGARRALPALDARPPACPRAGRAGGDRRGRARCGVAPRGPRRTTRRALLRRGGPLWRGARPGGPSRGGSTSGRRRGPADHRRGPLRRTAAAGRAAPATGRLLRTLRPLLRR